MFSPLNVSRALPGLGPDPVSQFIAAADGYELVAQRFHVAGAPRGFIVIAGAIGVPQRYYARFAQYARMRGHEVVTFDYRGIGRSAPRTLRGFRMDIRDWGSLDLAAVVSHIGREAEWNGVPLHVVAHSFGGHALAMLPSTDAISSCVTIGTGAGWHGWMPKSEQWRVLALWNVVGPALTWWKGYLPWRLLRMGEDLPADVYHQWRRWCRYPHYFLDDPDTGETMRAACARVRVPMLALSATDDRWSPPASRDAFLTGFVNAPVERIDLDPVTLELGPLGHMGFFRARASRLWPAAVDWLEQTAMREQRQTQSR